MWLNAFSPGFHPHPSPPSSPQTPYDTLGRDLRPKTYCLKNFTSMWGKISTVKRLETFSRKPLFWQVPLVGLMAKSLCTLDIVPRRPRGRKSFGRVQLWRRRMQPGKLSLIVRTKLKKWRESKRVPYRRGSRLSRIFFAKSPTLLSFQI